MLYSFRTESSIVKIQRQRRENPIKEQGGLNMSKKIKLFVDIIKLERTINNVQCCHLFRLNFNWHALSIFSTS